MSDDIARRGHHWRPAISPLEKRLLVHGVRAGKTAAMNEEIAAHEAAGGTVYRAVPTRPPEPIKPIPFPAGLTPRAPASPDDLDHLTPKGGK